MIWNFLLLNSLDISDWLSKKFGDKNEPPKYPISDIDPSRSKYHKLGLPVSMDGELSSKA